MHDSTISLHIHTLHKCILLQITSAYQLTPETKFQLRLLFNRLVIWKPKNGNEEGDDEHREIKAEEEIDK